jgi:uncharacterized protein
MPGQRAASATRGVTLPVARNVLSDVLAAGEDPGIRSPDKSRTLPLVWLLTCHREGDNAQMIGLAEALGWPFEVKRIAYKRLELVPNLLFRTTLSGIDERRSSRLEPPWPDLVIFAFRANENIARWIRVRAGGRTKFVVIGRPWSRLREFDLIVTTPQLGLPRRGNVLHNVLPLHRVTPERLAAAARTWTPRLAHLPRPYLAVLVGGTSGPYVFGRQAAKQLGQEVSALSGRLGGSVLVTTSARTSAVATRALWGAIDRPAYRYRWNDQQNPYFAFLALADTIVVTGESISMITEASAAGKPVLMFGFGGGPVAMRPSQSWRQWLDPYPETWIYALYMRLPRCRLNRTRDLRVVHCAVLASGRAGWLGDETSAGLPAAPSQFSDVARAVARVRALFADPSL